MTETTEYTWQNYVDFIDNVPPPQDELDFFSSVPWLQPYLEASSPYKAIPFFSRYDKGSTGDRFFNKTLNSEDTIKHSMALIHKDENWDKKLALVSSADAKRAAGEEWDFILLAHLGSDLCGHVDLAHGGLCAALFDEAMGCCTGTFRNQTPMFTAYLNVSYRAKVEVPSVVLLRVRLDRKQGRKWFLKGELVGSDGKVKTEADCLYINVKTAEKL